MENEVENTVEDMQEDNNAIKQMRERIKELESVEKEFKSVKMANAIKMQVLILNLVKVKHLKTCIKVS